MISDDVMREIDWRTQIGIIIKHIDIIQSEKVPRIKKFIGRLAYWLLEQKKDAWAFITLNLIIGSWSSRDLYENPNYKQGEDLKSDIALNFISTLLEKLTSVPDINKPTSLLLELSLSRALLYSNKYGMYQDSHEELHYVMENRIIMRT